MRVLLLSAVAAIALVSAAAPIAHAESQAAPGVPPAAAANENDKASQSLRDPPSAGLTEPSATNAAGAHKTPSQSAVFVDGMLNVPGAPSDSQTRPAKFSPHNDAIDKRSIMSMQFPQLDAGQRRAILAAINKANAPVATTQAKASEELPWHVAIHPLPQAVAGTADFKDLKYVRVADGALLVDAANRIVVGEIKQ